MQLMHKHVVPAFLASRACRADADNATALNTRQRPLLHLVHSFRPLIYSGTLFLKWFLSNEDFTLLITAKDNLEFFIYLIYIIKFILSQYKGDT